MKTQHTPLPWATDAYQAELESARALLAELEAAK
jgi:hypothetical protein